MNQNPITQIASQGATHQAWKHSSCSRRHALQIGAIASFGLGTNHLLGLRDATAASANPSFGKAKSCIFIFLSGGLAQHESFDMKPDAPEEIRGEFKPISTKTPGLQICEYLPKLAQISHLWSLCRTVTHSTNDHSVGHHVMLTGRSDLPVGFNPSLPQPTDFPSLASNIGYSIRPQNNLPPAVVLPERLIHNSGRVLPGQFAGVMGVEHDPWFVEASPFHPKSYGAFPQFAFDHQRREGKDERHFEAPQLTLPHGKTLKDIHDRVSLLSSLNRQRSSLREIQQTDNLDRYRQSALSMLTDAKVHKALSVRDVDRKQLERYGEHSFGWSLLMARQLVDCGVPLIQVNLGNNETWDTHGNAFPHLKDNLLPPMDQAVSALIEDLHASGQLEETLVVMAGEFGRTPLITHLKEHYAYAGRDHWGALQSVLFAGGGIKPGVVVGKSDAKGAYPVDRPVKPENFAATIYNLLGIPSDATWKDAVDRPHPIYHGDPVHELT